MYARDQVSDFVGIQITIIIFLHISMIFLQYTYNPHLIGEFEVQKGGKVTISRS